MSYITELTKRRLTRSKQPFLFKNEYDERLPYLDCDGLGLYVHIPFCAKICDFCPYCKTLYAREACDKYIDTLKEEIRLVCKGNEKKTVTGLYFGGGTPALAASRLKEIVDTLKEYFVITEGIGVELHPDNVTANTLQLLSDAGVDKISIGIQSFSDKYVSLLGRKAPNIEALKNTLSKFEFDTVSMDFIFALPGQTFEDLKSDVDTAFEAGANHVAIYPFIDFAFTESKIPAMKKREKKKLLKKITDHLAAKGCMRTSIWTFATQENAVYSSMTRDNFLGFGCSATSLMRDSFKINTFSVDEYTARIAAGKLPTSLTLRFTERQRMVYYLFWRAYGMKVDPADFESFFGKPLEKMYGGELGLARLLGFIKKRDGIYEMTPKGAFYYHYYENFYTLAYIDKMWGIMRNEAFPEKIEL